MALPDLKELHVPVSPTLSSLADDFPLDFTPHDAHVKAQALADRVLARPELAGRRVGDDRHRR